jgi:hypothetical protein
MSIASPPFDPSCADHTGGTCPDCKRPLARPGVDDPKLGGVTEDTLSFCLGPGTPGCIARIAWKHREDSGPGQPPPRTILGFKPAHVAIAGGTAALAAFLLAILGGGSGGGGKRGGKK